MGGRGEGEAGTEAYSDPSGFVVVAGAEVYCSAFAIDPDASCATSSWLFVTGKRAFGRREDRAETGALWYRPAITCTYDNAFVLRQA